MYCESSAADGRPIWMRCNHGPVSCEALRDIGFAYKYAHKVHVHLGVPDALMKV